MIKSYDYEVQDTSHNLEGNPLMEIHLFIKPDRADSWDITAKLSDFLESLITQEGEGE